MCQGSLRAKFGQCNLKETFSIKFAVE